MRSLFIAAILCWSPCWAQDKPEFVLSNGHKEAIHSLTYSPNGKYMVSAGQGRIIKIWDVKKRLEFKSLIGHKDRIDKLLISSDGKTLISQDRLDNLYIWKFPSGKLIRKLRVSDNVKFTVDGKYIIGEDQRERDPCLIDPLTGEIVKIYEKIGNYRELAIHPNGKQFATQARSSLQGIGLVGIESGLEEQTLQGFKYTSQTISFSPEGKYVISSGYNTDEKCSYVELYDLNSQKVKYATKLSGIRFIKNLIVSPSGKYFAAIGMGQATVWVHDLETGKQVHKLIGGTITQEQYSKHVQEHGVTGTSSMEYAMSAGIITISPDSRFISAGMTVMSKEGQKQAIRTWNLKTGKLVSSLEGERKYLMDLLVPKDEKMMFTHLMGGGKIGAQVWDMKNGEIRDFVNSYIQLTINEQGTQLAIPGFTNDQITDAVSNKGEGLSYYPINIYAYPQLNIERTIKTPGSPETVAYSMDGSILATQSMKMDMKTYAMDTRLILYDAKTGKELKNIPFESRNRGNFLMFNHAGDKIVSTFRPGYTPLHVYDIESGKLIASHVRTWATYPLVFDKASDKFLMGDVTEWKNGSNRAVIKAVDIVSGVADTVLFTDLPGQIHCADFSHDNKYLATGFGGFGDAVEFDVVVWDWTTKQKVCVLKGHTGPISRVVFGAGGKYIYSLSGDGTVKKWNFEKCKEQATFASLGDMEYLIITEGNYYKASKDITKSNVAFRYKEEVYGFSQFDLRYNRPDIVLEQLEASPFIVKMCNKAYGKRLRRMGFTSEMLQEDFHAPVARITNINGLPIETIAPTVTINVSMHDSIYHLNRVHINVNDIPLFGKMGKDISKQSTYKFEDKITIPLSAGENQIEVSCINATGAESFRQLHKVTYNKPPFKPDLYILSMGVSQYKDSLRNLTYAVKDAKDLAAALKRSKNFANVHHVSITDVNATKEHILTKAEFMKKAGVDDHVVIYISSHGLLDEQLDYYLATHDVDFYNPSVRGLPYSAVEDMIDASPSRNKLILIDACHSGEVDKEDSELAVAETETNVNVTSRSGGFTAKPKLGLRNSFAYMQALFTDVSKGTGATVISAAGGHEFAFESAKWKNGVFTLSLLEAFKKCDEATTSNGELRISELRDYVVNRVYELTKGKQVPTTRRENLVNDFVVY